MVEQAALRERRPGDDRDADPAPTAGGREQQLLDREAKAARNEQQEKERQNAQRTPLGKAIFGAVPPRFAAGDDAREQPDRMADAAIDRGRPAERRPAQNGREEGREK